MDASAIWDASALLDASAILDACALLIATHLHPCLIFVSKALLILAIIEPGRRLLAVTNAFVI